MIFGGTAIQTLILISIVMRCDWEKEVTRIVCFVAFVSLIYMVYFIFIYVFPIQLLHLSLKFVGTKSKYAHSKLVCLGCNQKKRRGPETEGLDIAQGKPVSGIQFLLAFLCFFRFAYALSPLFKASLSNTRPLFY